MSLLSDRPFADPDSAACKHMEIANSIDPVQDEKINGPSCSSRKAIAACKMGLEGLVSKRRDRPYRSPEDRGIESR
jgi:hypothetical protein